MVLALVMAPKAESLNHCLLRGSSSLGRDTKSRRPVILGLRCNVRVDIERRGIDVTKTVNIDKVGFLQILPFQIFGKKKLLEVMKNIC